MGDTINETNQSLENPPTKEQKIAFWIGALIALCVILGFPFILLYGLKLIGVKIVISTNSYAGAILIFLFITVTVKLANQNLNGSKKNQVQ